MKILPVIVKRRCLINPSYIGFGMVCIASQPGEVPELERLVEAAGEGGSTIERERDRSDAVRMAAEGMQLLAGCHLPELDRHVVAARQRGASIGRESDREDLISMPRQGAELSPGGDLR